MKIETPKTEQPCTLHGIKQRFDVVTYTIQEGEGMGYCHWSEGLNMIITKGDVILKLNSEEIQQIISSLPRTIGGTY